MEWSDFIKYFDLVYICHPALETILNIPVTCRFVTTDTCDAWHPSVAGRPPVHHLLPRLLGSSGDISCRHSERQAGTSEQV